MEVQEILYHYTDAKGLFGILDTKQIWASSYRYMSDAQEFYYGFDLISDLFPGKLPFQKWCFNFSGNSAELNFAEFIRTRKHHYDLDILFVASFSTKDDGDSLSQWRGYAGLHSGYSLGFSREILNSINSDTRLIACCYNKEQQLKELKELVNKYYLQAIKLITNHDPDDTFVILTDIGHRLAAPDVVSLSAKFKHEAFKDEEEWRLVVGPLILNDERICYRDSERVIIPYVKIDFNTTGLKHIIVGPGPHKERNERSLRQMLIQKGFKDVNVSVSKVPFRTW